MAPTMSMTDPLTLLNPPHLAQIHSVLTALECVLDGSKAAYVSAPFTTGPRFYEWRRGPGRDLQTQDPEYRRLLRECVIVPNRDRARDVAAVIRSKSAPKPVVDPTRLQDFEGWNQDDYRSLWGLAIQQFADEVFFLDGWWLSDGCSFEFLVACSLNLPLRTESGMPFSRRDGRGKIKEGVDYLKSVGGDCAFLETLLGEL